MLKILKTILSGFLIALFFFQIASAQINEGKSSSTHKEKTVELRGLGLGYFIKSTTNSLDLETTDTPDAAVEISYFFIPQIAIQLFATYVKTDIAKKGQGSLGSFSLFSPALTVQYHILPYRKLQPYVGLGFYYTNYSEPSGYVREPHFDITILDSFGFVAESGVEYQLPEDLFLNVNFKYLTSRPTFEIGATDESDAFTINSYIIGVGIGYRF